MGNFECEILLRTWVLFRVLMMAMRFESGVAGWVSSGLGVLIVLPSKMVGKKCCISDKEKVIEEWGGGEKKGLY